MSEKKVVHEPVLVTEVLEILHPRAGESYLDVTSGYGGHAKAVLKLTKSPSNAVLVDRDEQAAVTLKALHTADGAEIIHQDFLTASKLLAENGRHFGMILADLGVSSVQLDTAARGFSIRNTGPLDMRMDKRQEITATELLNSSSKDELAEIFARYGEEPKAKSIAKMVIENRPLKTTDQLASLAAKAWPGYNRVHPATRVFQALRIAVNDELKQLSDALPLWLEMLEPDGRLAIISFHSLEDRIVKQFFAEHSAKHYDGELKILTKKPIAASQNEIVSNPRARSAKLRAAAKIKTKIERN